MSQHYFHAPWGGVSPITSPSAPESGNSGYPLPSRNLRLRNSASRAISKRYLLTYPDGSRKHIGREERDSLLLAGCAKQTQPEKYLYIGPVHTFHSLADLSALAIRSASESTAYLQGQFIIVAPGGKKSSERLESVGGMTARLIKQGIVFA